MHFTIKQQISSCRDIHVHININVSAYGIMARNLYRGGHPLGCFSPLKYHKYIKKQLLVHVVCKKVGKQEIRDNIVHVHNKRLFTFQETVFL